MKFLITIFLLLLSLQFSVGQSYKNGSFKDYYDSGELKTVGQYYLNIKVGTWKNYHKNGNVSNIYSYKDGKRNMEKTSYFKNGIVSLKTELEEGIYVHFGYYESGNLKYKRQDKSGYFKSYYESGAKEIEANYIDNELSGPWKRYYESGEIEWIINYKDGYRNGFYKHFYENGDLKLEGNNYNDKVDGQESRFLLNNILEWKGNYKKGILVKNWTKFDENGKKVKKIKFENGVASKPEFSGVLKATKIPDGALEHMPVFPGCEDVFGNRAIKKCVNRVISKLIASHYDKKMIAQLGLPSGHKRILVMFKIDKTGHIKDVKARGPHPKLEAEAERIIRMLPIVKPGTQKGKPVIMPFSIPIFFKL